MWVVVSAVQVKEIKANKKHFYLLMWLQHRNNVLSVSLHQPEMHETEKKQLVELFPIEAVGCA